MANALGGDEQLTAGESRTSDNGRYRLAMQADGNLVLYRTDDNAPLWASQTAGRGGTRAVLQGDGNLVIYGDGDAVWASQTAGHPGATLTVQDDGNVVISAGGTALWATETATGQGAGGGAGAAGAEGTVVGGGLERVYVTKAGDTLDDLAGFFYGDAAHRQRLIDDNPELAGQSGSLPAGTRLRVPQDPTRGDAVSAS